MGPYDMITDIFARRYEGILNPSRYWAEKVLSPTLMQAGHIFFEDIQPALGFPDTFFLEVNQKLARELGIATLSLSRSDTQLQTSADFLVHPYQLFNDWHGDSDYFCRTRLSMLELLFRSAEEFSRKLQQKTSSFIFATNRPSASLPTVLRNGIEELNVRLRQSGTGLVYHNGFLHFSSDDQSTERIAKPFWEIVSDPKWAVVDQEMKEAVDRSDRSQRDAFTYATKALESTIKIISDENGWSTGNEKGAANYIDNLQSERKGRLIAQWEADALKAIFRDLRNPHSHGGGSNPPAPLSDVQQTWAIENCMTWIKSLVRRAPSAC
jgi:hypothetical protein